MKRPWILPAALVLAAAAFAGVSSARSAPAAATWSGDTVHSHVLFKIKHLGTSWSWGRFNDFTVGVTANEEGTELTGVEFDVKTASVDTGNAKRDGHLRTPDFFNAAQFPGITFKSKSVKATGETAWDVSGDLTLHGVTRPLTVRVAKVGSGKGMDGEKLLGLETTFTIKRSDFDMKSSLPAIGDEVMITVAVEAASK